MNTKTIEINEKQKELIREIFFEENTGNSTTGNKTGLQKYSFPTIWIAFVTGGIVAMQAIIQLVMHFLEQGFSFSGIFTVLGNIFTESLILIALGGAIIYFKYTLTSVKSLVNTNNFDEKIKEFQLKYLGAEQIDKDTNFYSSGMKAGLVKGIMYFRKGKKTQKDKYIIESDEIYITGSQNNRIHIIDYAYLMRVNTQQENKYTGLKIQPSKTNDFHYIKRLLIQSWGIGILIAILADSYQRDIKNKLIEVLSFLSHDSHFNEILITYDFLIIGTIIGIIVFGCWYSFKIAMRYRTGREYQNTKIDVTTPTDKNFDFYTHIINPVKDFMNLIQLNSHNVIFNIRDRYVYLKLDLKNTGSYDRYLSLDSQQFLRDINPIFHNSDMMQLMFHTIYFLNSHKAFEDFLEQNSESLL